ncbi:hypothetical protein EVAR_22602_1 [Eumeta japonica]|uniref:Uncharacterized protein n=1 Tax=Eumeta variegata TaxID=151549 RepID=A0A4C1U8U7_EUMVA|nr:hypothetical protein EVAR_22602_1 [Eumeta japonica]
MICAPAISPGFDSCSSGSLSEEFVLYVYLAQYTTVSSNMNKNVAYAGLSPRLVAQDTTGSSMPLFLNGRSFESKDFYLINNCSPQVTPPGLRVSMGDCDYLSAGSFVPCTSYKKTV